MLSDRAKLTFPSADVDGDGSTETGVFEFAGDLNITSTFRTGYLIGGRGAQVNNIFQSFVDQGDGPRGKGLFLDLGGGQHAIEIEFRSWEGAEDTNGNPLQWGDTGSTGSVTKTDATGAKALTQFNLLEYYVMNVKVDSFSPATLEYGEFSTSGQYSPLDVVVESPQTTKMAQDGEWIDGSVTFIETLNINDNPLSAALRDAL